MSLNFTINFNGFYESKHSDYIDGMVEREEEFRLEMQCEQGESSEINLEEEEVDYKALHDLYAKKYLEGFNKYLTEYYHFEENFLTYESLYSPREYNFETDRIVCSIPDDKVKIAKNLLNDEHVSAFIREATTRVSGYEPFYTKEQIKSDDVLLNHSVFSALSLQFEEHEFDQWYDVSYMYELIHSPEVYKPVVKKTAEDTVYLYGVSAYTTYKNTPETDNESEVWHTVIDQFNQKHQIMSPCPVTAIENFTRLKKEQTVVKVENNKPKFI